LVNSGSSANLVAFSALTSYLLGEKRIKKGDEVITVAAGFPTTINPIIQFGAIPVFVDIVVEDGSYQVDVSQLKEALSPKTKAVMIAHTLGNVFDLEAVTEFCKENNLWLVEDNCDALGSLYKNKPTGSWGDIATSSFYPPHHLTMGEGGAVYTNNPLLKRAAESFRDWGRDCWCPSGKDNTCKKRFNWQLGNLPKGYDHKYIYSHFGYNLKATEMQAAIGVKQLEKLDEFTRRRQENYNFLYNTLSKLESYFILPKATMNSKPSWFGFPISLRPTCKFERSELTTFLESKNIQTRMLFAGNILKHPMFDEMRNSGNGYRVISNLKNSDFVAQNTFWIGVYPGMSMAMLEFMTNQIFNFINGER
jgi:CDP-6-deoxy-D-xylo-4-hexulose-3-dehydrase